MKIQNRPEESVFNYQITKKKTKVFILLVPHSALRLSVRTVASPQKFLACYELNGNHVVPSCSSATSLPAVAYINNFKMAQQIKVLHV